MYHSPVSMSICSTFLPVSTNWSCFYPRPTPLLLHQVPYFFPFSSMCKYSSNNSPISLLILKFSLSTEPFPTTPNILKQTKLKHSLEFISPFSFSCYYISMPLKKNNNSEGLSVLMFNFFDSHSLPSPLWLGLSLTITLKLFRSRIPMAFMLSNAVIPIPHFLGPTSIWHSWCCLPLWIFLSFFGLQNIILFFFPFLMNCIFFVFFADLFSSPQPKSIHI